MKESTIKMIEMMARTHEVRADLLEEVIINMGLIELFKATEIYKTPADFDAYVQKCIELLPEP